jgi:F-type H+-transporting ATPase subunit alpha
MDKVELKKITDFEAALQSFARSNYKSLLDSINATPKFSKENEAALKKCIEDFIATGTY